MAEYKIMLDRKVLKLLGSQLYGDLPSVISELIANSYDADASNVWITLNTENTKQNCIVIEDDGKGMDANDINQAFLNIGYNKRENNSVTSLGRKVMGRKGIGKLAAFSLTNIIRVISSKKGIRSGCVIDFDKITLSNEEPSEISEEDMLFNDDRLSSDKCGTRLELINVKKRIAFSYRFIVSKLVRIFDVNDEAFKIFIRKNDEEFKRLYRSDLNYFEFMDTIVVIGDQLEDRKQAVINNAIESKYKAAFTYNEFLKLKQRSKLSEFPYELLAEDKSGNEVKCSYDIYGWIGTVDSLLSLKKINEKLLGNRNEEEEEKVSISDNRISLYSRGKLGEYDILTKIKSNTNNEAYVIGELFVDIFEDDNLSDMAISNRRGYEESDNRYTETIKVARRLLSFIIEQKTLVSKLRKEDFDQGEINKIKSTFLDKSDSKKIFVEKLTEQDRQIIDNELTQFTRAVNIANATKKIFISHKEHHKKYGQFIVDVLERYGIDVESTIIFTSDRRLGVPQGKNIYQYLKDCFRDDLLVIFIFSKSFYDSNICISEVGAAWATNKRYLNAIVDIDFPDIDNPCDSAQSSFKFKDVRTEEQKLTLNQFFYAVLEGIKIDTIDKSCLNDSIESVLSMAQYSDENINNSFVFCPTRKFLPVPKCTSCGNIMKLNTKEDGITIYKCISITCSNEIVVDFN